MDQDWPDPNEELAELTLEALERCRRAGGNDEDLYFLAAQLGVGYLYRRQSATANTTRT